MKRRTLALAGSIAALSLVGAPIAVAASGIHHGANVSRTDRSLDVRGAKHVDKSPDRSRSVDRSSKDSRLDR